MIPGAHVGSTRLRRQYEFIPRCRPAVRSPPIEASDAFPGVLIQLRKVTMQVPGPIPSMRALPWAFRTPSLALPSVSSMR
jgi:hypothetical protein